MIFLLSFSPEFAAGTHSCGFELAEAHLSDEMNELSCRPKKFLEKSVPCLRS